jgi:NAD(P)-dependent dehydrogenase (short-subunit alcohol dehydrogenase family)
VTANHRFDGMMAVITGGASGIGLAVANRIIVEGGQITLWDVELEAAQAKFGPKVRPKSVDITNPEEIERAAKDAEADIGSLPLPRWGKMPMTSVRRLISPLRRSSGLMVMEWVFGR